jgi:hypothetical protein
VDLKNEKIERKKDSKILENKDNVLEKKNKLLEKDIIIPLQKEVVGLKQSSKEILQMVSDDGLKYNEELHGTVIYTLSECIQSNEVTRMGEDELNLRELFVTARTKVAGLINHCYLARCCAVRQQTKHF